MEQRTKLRLSVLGAALATTAVFAGTYAVIEEPATPIAGDTGTTVITEKETLVATPQESVMPAEQVAIPTIQREPAPVVERSAAPAEPPITVVEQRLTEDEVIQLAVMDALRNNPTLTGKVGVESKDRVVMLSGHLMTMGQVRRAGRDAHVENVRYVINEIRPKVGPVTN